MTLTLSSLDFPPPLRSNPCKSSSQPLKSHLLHNFETPLQLQQIHAHFIKTNSPLSSLSLAKVASVCALTPHFSYAQKLFSHFQLQKQEPFIWNSCLRDFAESDSPFDAILLFYQMRFFDVLPDSYTCSFVLKACTSLCDVVNGRIVHGIVAKLGFGSDLFLQNVIMNLYASCGEMYDAVKLFDKMPQRDVVTWNIMITQLVKKGDLDEAYEFFWRLPERNVRSWTLMISGYVKCGQPKEAIGLFIQLEEAGIKPNEVTIVSVLAACADLGALDLGRRVHEYANRSGFKKNSHVCNTLIDMYVKCGCLEDARRVFDEMEDRTVVSWSAMIAGLAMHGKAEEALGIFSEMIEAGMKPNEVTFLGLLHACSHMGLVDKGRGYFASMVRDYEITPQIQHYGCMVDLLSRAGLLWEAREFIKNMPVKPNGVVWGALLGGCKVHRNIRLAEEAIEHLYELDPLNDGYYIVLSNIYAEAERWEDVARVRMLMKERGVKKTRGWSSITVDRIVHEFVAGDETHPHTEQISQMWEQLLDEMKQRGYKPKTSVVLLDVEEEEKEKLLYRHSEKLAVAFGLMNIPAGKPIRIMKNLRVCEDCHAAMKLISTIHKREIIVRDRNRFHCFKDGFCSCNDYW